MPRSVTILKGLPASGKSTWAKEQVQKSQGHTKRVNKDDLRAMLDDGKYSKNNEKFVLLVRDMLILEALRQGHSVIVDDTNLNPKHEEDIRQIVKDYISTPIQFVVKEFDTPIDECIARDLKRPNSVGADVIRQMAKRWRADEHGLAIPEVNMEIATVNGLPWCIIYDLDGTAAIMGDRSPYDASKCDEVDRPNQALQHILWALHDTVKPRPIEIIAMSGRSDIYAASTKRFLEKHKFPYRHLYMRADGDNRKDAIIKRELFDKHIKDKYNVLAVFDDRNQMVDMWRNELNLPCFQVNYGDF